MTTEFATTYDLVDVKSITVHPNNPRHSAKADVDMVASVREHGLLQPLVVAPTGEPGAYVLIAGHRRFDALKRVKAKTAPALIRPDLNTPGLQLEQMLVENIHRCDLSPIEEAEGFAQLQLFKYTQKQIAEVTGRAPNTIKGRLKLLKLGKQVQAKVHSGQLSIDDAIAIADYADEPDVVKDLERAAGTTNFKYTIESARRRKKEARDVAASVADLTASGVPQTDLNAGTGRWSAFDDVDGVVRIAATPLRDPTDHDGCLTFGVLAPSSYSGPEIVYGCTHPTGHDGEMSESDRTIRQQNEQADVEREARKESGATARAVRVQTVMSQARDNTLPEWLATVARATIGASVDRLEGDALVVYQDAMGLAEADRWAAYAPKTKKRDRHLEDLDGCGDTCLSRALVGVLLAAAEANLASSYARRDDNARRHLELLEALGHPFCHVDDELLASVNDEGAEP